MSSWDDPQTAPENSAARASRPSKPPRERDLEASKCFGTLPRNRPVKVVQKMTGGIGTFGAGWVIGVGLMVVILATFGGGIVWLCLFSEIAKCIFLSFRLFHHTRMCCPASSYPPVIFPRTLPRATAWSQRSLAFFVGKHGALNQGFLEINGLGRNTSASTYTVHAWYV